MRIAVVLVLLTLGLAACGEDDSTEAEGPSFEGVPWLLSSGIDVAGWQAVAPSATFADGTVGGSTGCNHYTAGYAVDGDALDIGDVASTRMACPSPADAVEREYLAALDRVEGWGIDDDDLVLVDADDDEALRFRTATPTGDWEVTSFLDGDALVSPLAGTRITASFAADETLTGSAGCNSYSASFTIGSGAIEITQPSATRKACAEPEGVMAQEAAYLAALPTAVRYRVDGGSLALLSADGTYVVAYARARP
jgi:heat shock protein HslJ